MENVADAPAGNAIILIFSSPPGLVSFWFIFSARAIIDMLTCNSRNLTNFDCVC